MPPGTAAIEVLAETSPSVRFKQPHPAVWITSHPRARIVGITLGHDERVHDLDGVQDAARERGEVGRRDRSRYCNVLAGGQEIQELFSWFRKPQDLRLLISCKSQ